MVEWSYLRDWRNRQDTSLSQLALVSDDCERPAVVFPDEDTEIKFVFKASLAQVTRMLSALEKGSILSYPTEWHNVWWSFVRNLECTVTICDEVADCIESTPAVRDAIDGVIASALREPTSAVRGALSDIGVPVPGQPLSPTQAASDLLPANVKPGGICDNDALWGACLYLVQSGNRTITDFFEILALATDVLEAAQTTLNAIPVVGQYIGLAAGYAGAMQDWLADSYSAVYTESYEQGLACDLFCAAQDTCELSLDAAINVMNTRLSAPIDISDYAEIITAFITHGAWVGDEIADISFLLFLTSLKFGQKFGGQVGVLTIQTVLSLGADQLASNNWEVLCTDCATFPTAIITPDAWFETESNFGTNLTYEGNGYWIATSTLAYGVDHRVSIMESGGLAFNLTDMSYPDGIAAYCHVSRSLLGVPDLRCAPPLDTAPHDRYMWIFPSLQRVRFRMTYP